MEEETSIPNTARSCDSNISPNALDFGDLNDQYAKLHEESLFLKKENDYLHKIIKTTKTDNESLRLENNKIRMDNAQLKKENAQQIGRASCRERV